MKFHCGANIAEKNPVVYIVKKEIYPRKSDRERTIRSSLFLQTKCSNLSNERVRFIQNSTSMTNRDEKYEHNFSSSVRANVRRNCGCFMNTSSYATPLQNKVCVIVFLLAQLTNKAGHGV